MVRFNKKESEARKELLASMNQVNDAKESENGKSSADLASSLNPLFLLMCQKKFLNCNSTERSVITETSLSVKSLN